MSACNSKDRGLGHPGFLPYAPLRNELIALSTTEWIRRCNGLARRRQLCSTAGAPLSFVAAEATGGALGYEATILHEGRIACRPAGRGALHDLHNALVWLTFPRLKALLNQLHFDKVESGGSGRGRVRDRVTLLDESGLLWVSRSSRLDELLQGGQWRELLVVGREQVRAGILPIVIGHGLLEKLAAPYKAMTAHCLICPVTAAQDLHAPQDLSVPQDRSDRSDAMAPLDESLAALGFGSAQLSPRQLAALDDLAAQHLAATFATSGPRLAPLPILGLPAWDAANLDESYYDDPRVFREPRFAQEP